MHPQRWDQIADLFAQLTELPVEQRTAFWATSGWRSARMEHSEEAAPAPLPQPAH